jgi:hypothetical protein
MSVYQVTRLVVHSVLKIRKPNVLRCFYLLGSIDQLCSTSINRPTPLTREKRTKTEPAIPSLRLMFAVLSLTMHRLQSALILPLCLWGSLSCLTMLHPGRQLLNQTFSWHIPYQRWLLLSFNPVTTRHAPPKPAAT